jgi:hypothetical protein
VAILSPTLLACARLICGWLAALNGVHFAQLPMLVSSAALAGSFRILPIPFAGILANVFSMGQFASTERQTARLKRNRVRIQKARPVPDGFEVE